MDIERLKRKHVFEFLTAEQIDALNKDSEIIDLKEGELVYQKGEKAEYLYVVLSGVVAIRLPERKTVSILIDELTEGTMFGSCVFPTLDSYFCSAQCAKESELLRIRSAALKKVLEDDPRTGYAIQARISQIYFKRYMETMKKLQAIVKSIPIESAE